MEGHSFGFFCIFKDDIFSVFLLWAISHAGEKQFVCKGKVVSSPLLHIFYNLLHKNSLKDVVLHNFHLFLIKVSSRKKTRLKISPWNGTLHDCWWQQLRISRCLRRWPPRKFWENEKTWAAAEQKPAKPQMTNLFCGEVDLMSHTQRERRSSSEKHVGIIFCNNEKLIKLFLF